MSSRREDGSSSRRNASSKGMSKSSAGGYRRRFSVDNRLEAAMLQGSSSRLMTDSSTPAYLHSSTTMTSTTARGSRRRHSVTTGTPTDYSPDSTPDDSGGSGRIRTAAGKKKMTPQEISEKRYTQKLRQAQDVLRQYNSKQIRHQHVVAPRATGAATTNKDKYKLISRVADETKLHEKQHLLKAPRSSRRQSLAATEVDTRHFEGSAMTPRERRRYSMTASVAVGAPPAAAGSRSNNRPEGTATATRLKKAFSDDGMPQYHPQHVQHIPRRGHSADPEVPPLMPKPNYSSSNNNHHHHHHGLRTSPTRDGSNSGSSKSRRRSLAAGISSNNEMNQSETSLTDDIHPRHHQHHHHATRHSSIKDKDMASRTTWKTPKDKDSIPLGVDSFRDLESSMPSLQALDLSIHTNGTAPGGGKRVSSDSQSILTLTTHETEDTTVKNNRTATAAVLRDAAQPKQLLSLTVDNAFSHGQSQSALLKDGSGNNNRFADDDDYDDYDEDFDYGDEPDEASTICNSVGDYNSNHGKNGSNHEKHRRTRSKRNMSSGNNRSSSSLDKMSRSEGGGAHRRCPSEGSGGKGGSRRSMGGGSYVEGSTRRRTASNMDDSGLQEGTSSRRRNRSSSHHKSSSGMSASARETSSSRRGSSRNLRVTKAHSAGSDDERRQQRRASTSVRSLSTDRSMSRTGSGRKMSSSQRSLTQRSRPDSPNPTQSPRRQKSSNSLKGDNSATTPPRRTKKQGRSQSMALGSAANAAVGHLNLDSIDKKSKDKFQNKKSSSMSVGAGSLGSAKSGKGRRSKPRRHLSNGSNPSIGSSNGSGSGRRRTRDAAIGLPDAADMTDKGDLDASVTTPPTVSSSSADEKLTGPHDDFTAAFEDMTHGPNTFSLNAAEIDPFDDHIAPSGDPFGGGGGLPDPFHLSKPIKDGAFGLGHAKADDIDPASSSFHMSSDFGDFGQASFGSMNFEVDKRATPS